MSHAGPRYLNVGKPGAFGTVVPNEGCFGEVLGADAACEVSGGWGTGFCALGLGFPSPWVVTAATTGFLCRPGVGRVERKGWNWSGFGLVGGWAGVEVGFRRCTSGVHHCVEKSGLFRYEEKKERR